MRDSVIEYIKELPHKQRVSNLAQLLLSISTEVLFEAIDASMNQLKKVEDEEGPAQAKQRRSSFVAPAKKVYVLHRGTCCCVRAAILLLVLISSLRADVG